LKSTSFPLPLHAILLLCNISKRQPDRGQEHSLTKSAQRQPDRGQEHSLSSASGAEQPGRTTTSQHAPQISACALSVMA
jgi:hypothetical protein